MADGFLADPGPVAGRMALRRFQRERGLTLPRPVAINSPLQTYFVDPEFAAVVTPDVFGDVGCA